MNEKVRMDDEKVKTEPECYAAEGQETQGDAKDAEAFRRLAPACLLYALVYTFCIYKNISGITAPVWMAVTIGFACYAVRIVKKKIRPCSYFYMAVLFLVGVSTFVTGNEWVIRMNYIVFFGLLIGFLLCNLMEEEHWDAGTYASEMMKAVWGAVCSAARPLSDGNAYLKTKRKEGGKAQYVVLGACLAVPVVFSLGTLLMGADLVFAGMVRGMFAGLRMPRRVFGIVFMFLSGFFSSYCGLDFMLFRQKPGKRAGEGRGEPLLALTIASAVAALYLFFCAIQVIYLFPGGRIGLPEGLTYAEYARKGFFQLLFICALNLLLVAGVKKYFKKHKALDAVLIVISLCTIVMTASSACRMLLYIGAYQLTFLRLCVLAALAVISLLMLGMLCFLVRPQFPLFRYGTAVVCIAYLIAAFSHADYFIASYNLARWESGRGTADYRYLSCLSTDAAPAIAGYAEAHLKEMQGDAGEEWEYRWLDAYLAENYSAIHDITARNFNLSHYRAKRLFGEWDQPCFYHRQS